MFHILLLALFAHAQAPPQVDSVRLFLGPMPDDSNGAPVALPKAFKDSYADLRRVHGKQTRLYRKTSSVPPLVLVDEAADADLVLTVTHRGPKPGTMPILIARLTVRRAGDTFELLGISPGRTGKVRWTEQAERIYRQTIAFTDSSYAALVRLRAVR